MGFIEDKNIYPKKEGVKRKDTYESIVIDPNADIPIELITKKLNEKIALYRNL